jgi:cold shock protein
MPSGTVKFFDEENGWGFITPDQPGRDVFVHVRDVRRAGREVLYPGQKLHFDIVTDKKTGRVAAGNLHIPR